MKYFTTIIFIIFIIIIAACDNKNEIELFSEKINGKKIKLRKIDSLIINEDSTSFIGKFLDVKYRGNNIVIADMLQSALFFYNDEGKNIKQLRWRKGEGPGEILQIGGFEIMNGYIYISDIGNFRWTVFDTSGKFIKWGRPFSDPRDDKNEFISENGNRIEHFQNNIFTTIIEDKYNRDSYQYYSKSIAKLDSNLTIKQVFGNMDKIYGKFKIYIPSPALTIDSDGYIYFSQRPTYKIYKYDQSGVLVKCFGVKGNFKILDEDLSRNLSMNEIIRISKKYSFTDALFFSSRGYILHQYIEVTDIFYDSRSTTDRLNYLKVYDLDGRYIDSDILLEGVLLATNGNGDLLILEKDEPGNRIIGVYKIELTDN
ncbi:6-bladed beta-propeller [Ignavibacterium album]|nr:6-bladed beta-propeller [Ignavibacterium album]